MGVNYLQVSAFMTVLSFSGLHWSASGLLRRFAVDGIVKDGAVKLDVNVLEMLRESQVSVALVVNFLVNVFVFAILCLKLLCLASRMFQILAKDRLERLNASPSATHGTYFRVFSALLFVLISDILWICLCMITCCNAPTSMVMLLLFEPLSIAFETLQAIIVYGFQFLEMWRHCSLDNDDDCHGSPSSYKSAGASLCEWKSILNRNFGFVLDTMTLFMAAGHYLIIWWLHGMSFHLVDAILFMNLRALLSAIIKRTRSFIKLRNALISLDCALHDATSEELRSFDDDCAICRAPMSKAKRLSCNHIFHLPCLRSWLDQGISEVYSCPTCRRPLFPSSPVDNATVSSGEVVQHVEQYDSQGVNQQTPGPTPTVPTRTSPTHEHNVNTPWRGPGPGLDATWSPPWPNPVVDIASTSGVSSSGSLNRVQIMMRHLASVSESYAHSALEDSSWNFWPPQSASAHGNHTSTSGLSLRSTSPTIIPNMSDILVMAERVREILPHIPDELIIQDLHRTNNATTTVNNFLPT